MSLFLCAAAAAVAVPSARAQERHTPSLRFNAFGTLGAAYSTDGRANYVWNPLRPEGPGFGERVSLDLDTNLGGQLTATLLPRLTAVLQVVADQNAEDHYTPHVEWANVEYGLTPNLSVRVGRTVLDVFLASDYRKVSYANPWIRPPVEFYDLVPLFSVDGADAAYRWRAGDWTTRVHATFGRATADAPGGAKVRGENGLTVSFTAERGGLTARAALERVDLTITSFESLFSAVRSFGAQGAALAARLEPRDRHFEFATVGVRYDPGRWFAMGELGWTNSHSILGESAAGYVTAGVRLGPFAPYATYSRSQLLSNTSTAGLSLAGLPPERAAAAAGLNAALNAILQSMVQQQSVSLGGRWDFRTGMALKGQVDFIDRLDHSPGTYANPQPGFKPGGTAALVSLAAVFVL